MSDKNHVLFSIPFTNMKLSLFFDILSMTSAQMISFISVFRYFVTWLIFTVYSSDKLIYRTKVGYSNCEYLSVLVSYL
jgi:hypothetical protein